MLNNKPGFRVEVITPDGVSYDLHNPPDRTVSQFTGWGISPHSRSITRNPFQQGSTVISQRLDERTIGFTLRHNGFCRSGFLGNRLTYVDLFRENLSPLFSPEPGQLIYHYIENGAYTSRALDVYFEDGFSFAPPRQGVWDYFAIQETLTFVAHDPIIYDPTALTVTITAFDEELILPVVFPFILGGFIITQNIVNSGTWETYPIITVTGPAKNVSFENLSTNKRINYAGEIPSGEIVTFDLSYDKKTVTDSCGNDLLTNVSGDLGTFSLQCDPLVTSGINSIQIGIEEYSPGTTQIVFTYFTRYRGI